VTRRAIGERIEPRRLESIDGRDVVLPNPNLLVHFQFRRFAGCPYCNLHVRSLASRADEISRAGVHEILVFHSTRKELLAHQGEVPFDVVADPGKVLYREFGVEKSWRAELRPGAWRPAMQGVRRKPAGLLADKSGGILGLPADFLIGSDGTILACHYGSHAYDQWSVDELVGPAAGQHVPGAVRQG
jgi:AhpC/TSA antioxidant enzyme